MINVIITKLPIVAFNTYQWLLLGLNELERQGIIKLSYDIPFLNKFILLWTSNKWISGVARRFIHRTDTLDDFTLLGKIEKDGFTKSFALDPKDSPNIFNVECLENVDSYFKLQCPIEIKKEGFELAKGVILPWFDLKYGTCEYEGRLFKRVITDKVYKFRDKIKPGMIGPRRLAWSCKYSVMKKQYDKYLDSQKINSTGKLCAYFRFAQGPKPTENLSIIDPDLEWDIMAAYPQLNHPNEKRDLAVKYMVAANDNQIDGRMIYEKNESGETIFHPEREVPLPEFCDWIAKYNYNLNISGYRMSIPNRFIESFIAGTGIVTDKLSLKWYLPFDEEVKETVKMGYEPAEKVDWEGFKKDISSLENVSKERIIELYEKKWSPLAFAKYVIKETLEN